MKTAVITGANRGIGLALCKEYLAQGWRVIGLCRKGSPELSATDALVIADIDVTQAEPIAQLPLLLTPLLNGQTIDLLINNAGILRSDNLGNLDSAAIVEQFLVNAEAPLRIAETLLGLLSSTAKLAFITSRMGSIADNSSGGYYGYRMSKAALNAAAVSLSIDLKPHGIAVGVFHPGYVKTAMVNFGGDITAEESARRLSQRIAELTLANSGGFWHSNGNPLPW